MRGKCKSLRIAIIVAIVATILAAIFQFLDLSLSDNMQAFLFTMSSGCAASALATIFILTSEYKHEKRNTLERYWQQQLDLNKKIKSIKYFSSNIQIELIIKYIGYKQNKINFIKEDILEEWIKAKGYTYDKNMLSFYERSVEDDFQNTVLELEAVLESYKGFRNINYRVQENTYSDILFLGDIIENSIIWKVIKKWYAIRWIVEKVELSVNKQRNDIYKKIHEPMRNMLNELQKFEKYIIGYSKKEYSLDFILRELDEFQKQQKLFGIEEDVTHFTVYADFYDKMDRNIETFRSSVIYKCKPEYLLGRTEVISKLKRNPD